MTVHGSYLVTRREGDVLIIGFLRADVIDLDYIRCAGDELEALVNAENPPRLIIDFEGVRYLSSPALSLLVSLSDDVRTRKGDLRIANVADEVYAMFRLAKIPDLIETHRTMATAVRSMH